MFDRDVSGGRRHRRRTSDQVDVQPGVNLHAGGPRAADELAERIETGRLTGQ
jgi:hypothetical protein